MMGEKYHIKSLGWRKILSLHEINHCSRRKNALKRKERFIFEKKMSQANGLVDRKAG